MQSSKPLKKHYLREPMTYLHLIRRSTNPNFSTATSPAAARVRILYHGLIQYSSSPRKSREGSNGNHDGPSSDGLEGRKLPHRRNRTVFGDYKKYGFSTGYILNASKTNGHLKKKIVPSPVSFSVYTACNYTTKYCMEIRRDAR